MNNISLLYCAILCAVFVCLNLNRIGLRNKTFILPSTLFALMWGITSLGGYLYSNNMIGNSDYYVYASNLETIGNYQFLILLTAFIAFILVHIKYKRLSIQIPFSFAFVEVPMLSVKLRWFLYAFFW